MNSLKEKKEKVDEQRQIYEKELFYLNKASVGEYEKFIESLTSDELLLYHWIKEYLIYDRFNIILMDPDTKQDSILG